MTDDERAARIAALSARRTLSETPNQSGSDGSPRRNQRGHAAVGGRVLALGLSAAAAVVLTAAMANGTPPAEVTSAVPDAPAPIVVRVVLADGGVSETNLLAAPVVSAAPSTMTADATSRAS